MPSPSAIITLGLGTWGSPSDIITLGYTSAAFVARISVTLTDASNVPIPNLTGLRAAWWDQSVLNTQVAPVRTWTGLTTDAGGILFTNQIVLGSVLGTGQVGWLEVTDSDGTSTQAPVANVAAGPITIQ